MRKIKYIVIHCTATQQSAKVSSILNYWKKEKGWRYPGYHRLIESCGKVNSLMDFEGIANGVRGHNHESIHISYVGGVDKNGKPLDNRTYEQTAQIMNSIREALHWTMLHQDELPDIVGHNDLNPGKACPSFDAREEFNWITI